ncbi:MAG: EAL domain-containing protein [Myxococcales bacterium]|nr:EAL domain-containing protein [Myxococcales bacterium]
MTLDLAGRILSVNQEFRRMTGYTDRDLLGESAKTLRHPSIEDAFFADVWRTVSAGRVWCGRLKGRRKDGSPIWTRCAISPDNWQGGLHHGYRVAQVPVSEDCEPRGCAGGVAEEQRDELGALFRRSPEPQLVFESGVVVDCNDAAVALLGRASQSELIGRSIVELSPSRQPAGVSSAEASSVMLSRCLTEETFRCRWAFVSPGSEPVFVELVLLTLPAVGACCRLHARLQPTGAEPRARGLLLGTYDERDVALSLTSDGVLTLDDEGRVMSENRAALRLLGCSSEEIRGAPLRELLVLQTIDARRVACPWEGDGIDDTARRCGEYVLLSSEGEERFVELSCAPLVDASRSRRGQVVVLHDITSTRVMAQQLTWQASHDALTGLQNRREFRARLEALVHGATQSGREHALLYFDVDQFKLINDTCGHAAGDALIVQISGLLRDCLQSEDLLARLGGDEFGIILGDCPLAEARLVAKQLLGALRGFRFAWEDKLFRVSASIGLSPITSATRDAATALSSADLACHMAKEKGRNRLWVHDGDAESRRRRGEMQWIHRIEKALSEERLCLYYQEIQSTRDGAGPGARVEVLVRLNGEDGQLVQPMAFIPPAERYQVMNRIDRWVIDRTFAWIAQRRAAGRALPVFDINISGQSLGQELFLDFVIERLARYRLPPDRLCFEVTETVAVSNVVMARTFIDELVGRGCEFALDDFGRGMSSFTYLKHLPVNILKIDGSFVKNMREDPLDRAMVESVNHIGHMMGMQTIAEFVGDHETAAALAKIGVDWVQGFGIHRPAPLSEMP